MKFTLAFTFSLLFQLLFAATLSAQSWKWAISSGYTSPLLINKSYTSSEGITVATGSYMDSVKIGHVALVNPGSGKFFIAVINADGSVSHVFSDGQSFPELEPVAYGQINTVFLDKDKNIFIAGLGTHEIKFGNQTYTAAGNTQSFIAKYTYYGTLLWVKTFSSPGYYNEERMNEFKIDDNGNIYCTGLFREGDLNISGTILHSSSIENAYLIKYNSDAELQWAQTFTGNNLFSYGYHLAVSNEKVYWMGNFSGDLTLQGQSLASENGGGGFLACLDHDGTLSWINNSKGYAEESLVYGDSMLIVGYYNTKDTTLLGEHLDYSALYLVAYDINGNGKWVKQIVKPDLNSSVVSYSDFYSLFIDMENNIGVGGRFAGDVTLGETAVSSVNGSSDIFLLKSNALDGGVSEFITLGSNKTEYPSSIAMDQCGNNYFTGLYVDSTRIGDIKLVNESTSLFVAKYENNPDCLLPLPTAIATPSASNTLALYPNPAHQAVNIAFPAQPKEEVTVIIYNEMGKTESVKAYEINGTNLELPIHLVPGLYVVKVISSEQTYTSKLVIE